MKFKKSLIMLASLATVPTSFAMQANENYMNHNHKHHAETVTDSKLVFASTLIRHGDRTPWMLMKNPESKYDWVGKGQLTPKGMNEEYKLGKHLRKLLVEKYNLLPKTYTDGAIQAWAGQQDRLVVSTESLLYGLYPLGTGPKLSSGEPALPGALNPIPIFTLPDSPTFDAGYGQKVKTFEHILKEQVYNQPIWKENNSKISAKQWRKWSKIAGYKMTNLYDSQGFFDNLNVRYIHDIPFPTGININTFKRYYPLIQWSEAYIFYPRTAGYLEGGTILGNLNKHLKSHIKNPNQKLKYVIYGGHDVTISGVMSALGVPLEKNPHYASHMNFELFENNNDNYFVKVTYNGKDVQIPACKGKEYCTYRQFNKLIHKITVNKDRIFAENYS